MVAPITPITPTPLSPQEKAALTDHDRMMVDAWMYRLNGRVPVQLDFLRLFLLGKLLTVK